MFVKRLRNPEDCVFASDDIGDVIDLYQKNQRHYNLILNLQEHVKNKLDMSDLTWCLRHNVDLNEYFHSNIDPFNMNLQKFRQVMESNAEYGNHGLNDDEQAKFDTYALANLVAPG